MDYAIGVNAECRSISEATTVSCKRESTMFFDTDIWELDSYKLKEILDKHFRLTTSRDVYAKLNSTTMKSTWKPDIIEFEKYCNRFTKILSELDPSTLPEVPALCYRFINGLQPKVLRDDIKTLEFSTVRACAYNIIKSD